MVFLISTPAKFLKQLKFQINSFIFPFNWCFVSQHPRINICFLKTIAKYTSCSDLVYSIACSLIGILGNLVDCPTCLGVNGDLLGLKIGR